MMRFPWRYHPPVIFTSLEIILARSREWIHSYNLEITRRKRPSRAIVSVILYYFFFIIILYCFSTRYDVVSRSVSKFSFYLPFPVIRDALLTENISFDRAGTSARNCGYCATEQWKLFNGKNWTDENERKIRVNI